jgi:hypothetical protein
MAGADPADPRWCFCSPFQLANARVSAPECFILHQRRLHEGVGRVWSLAQSILDQTFRLGIALGVFKSSKAIEQLGDEPAFLRGHGSAPSAKARLI